MQVQLSEQQLEILRETADREQASVSAMVRRAVDAWIAEQSQLSPAQRRSRAIAAAGRFGSGTQDVSERHDDYLADAFSA